MPVHFLLGADHYATGSEVSLTTGGGIFAGTFLPVGPVIAGAKTAGGGGEGLSTDGIGRGRINLSSARRARVKYRAFKRNMIRTGRRARIERSMERGMHDTWLASASERRFRVK